MTDSPSTASIDARLCELLLLHMRGDHAWARAVVSFANDVRGHDQVPDQIPELLSAFCRYALIQSLACHGAEATIARLESDLVQLHAAAAKRPAHDYAGHDRTAAPGGGGRRGSTRNSRILLAPKGSAGPGRQPSDTRR